MAWLSTFGVYPGLWPSSSTFPGFDVPAAVPFVPLQHYRLYGRMRVIR